MSDDFTIRERFAMAALTGLFNSLDPGDVYSLDYITKQAYELADAMLRERDSRRSETARNGETNHDAAPAATAAEPDHMRAGPPHPAAGTGDICERLRRWTHAVDAEPASDLMDEAADEIERLRAAIRRLADQDATLSVCKGNVTVEVDAAMTPEEREVIAWALDEAESQLLVKDACYGEGHERNAAWRRRVVALRGLLERLG